ncbi:hypothetical protein CYMTET_9076, partial [Cymbomonas tetramitiformis]
LRREGWGGKLVWILAPARQYKPIGGHNGQCVCQSGVRDQCKAGIYGAFHEAGLDGQVVHRLVENRECPYFFDTIDRRRHMNSLAESMVLKYFPDATIMDYWALTEPLPTDYNFDGEHYHCPKQYKCKTTANSVAANVLANLLCNGKAT